ncbi:hypothetical protein L7F22_007637 [Adiantum nelumboides]|nr:hypothetical protein [Adiantum nelumboides]
MLGKFPNSFITLNQEIRIFVGDPMKIELIEGAKPVRQKLRRMCKEQMNALKEGVDKLLNARFIAPVDNAEWSLVVAKRAEASTGSGSSLSDSVVQENLVRVTFLQVEFGGLLKGAILRFVQVYSFCKMSKNDGISGFVSDKLDKNNFHAWKFRMTNFLMGKGYWDYIDGNQEEMPDLPDVNPTTEQIKAFKDWNQGARKAWDRLVSVDTTNTKARKIQLKNELNTVKKETISINDYTLKIKGIVESLASISVQVEDDDKVEVCLHGLTPVYKQFKTSIQTRENIPCFADLVPMLVVEEKNLGEDSSSSQGKNNSEQVFYSNKGRGRGRGAGQGRGHGCGNQNQGQQ